MEICVDYGSVFGSVFGGCEWGGGVLLKGLGAMMNEHVESVLESGKTREERLA